jgi:hypothetical protein
MMPKEIYLHWDGHECRVGEAGDQSGWYVAIDDYHDLLEALEGLVENYQYNNGQGLGIGPLSRARRAIAKAKEVEVMG